MRQLASWTWKADIQPDALKGTPNTMMTRLKNAFSDDDSSSDEEEQENIYITQQTVPTWYCSVYTLH